MSYSSAEKNFYQRHYQGGLQFAQDDAVRAAGASHFAPGKRYHLLTTALDPQQRHGTAVEIGCAGGDCIAYLGSRFQFERLIGVDIAFPDGMDRRVGNVQFLQANSNEKLPLPDSSVDVYIAMMVIEHLFDPFHAFAEIARVLSPQGRAFVNLPLVTSIKNRLRLLAGRLPVTSVPFERWMVDREWDGNHLHYFSMDAIRRLASMHGMALTKVAGVGAYHRVKSLAPSLLANEVSFVLVRRPPP